MPFKIVINLKKMAGKSLFKPLNADDIEPEITEILSLCMNCHKDVSMIL